MFLGILVEFVCVCCALCAMWLCEISGTDYKNKGEFTFSFWASLYADDAATPLASREALLAGPTRCTTTSASSAS